CLVCLGRSGAVSAGVLLPDPPFLALPPPILLWSGGGGGRTPPNMSFTSRSVESDAPEMAVYWKTWLPTRTAPFDGNFAVPSARRLPSMAMLGTDFCEPSKLVSERVRCDHLPRGLPSTHRDICPPSQPRQKAVTWYHVSPSRARPSLK